MQLLEKDDEIGIVDDNFQKFQQLYHPVWQNKFKDVIHLSDGKFVIDISPQARKILAKFLNENIYMNIEKFSVLLFDQDQKLHKKEFTHEEKEIVASKLVEDPELVSHLNEANDRIMLLHRNTKLFLFMMTGPFLVIL